LLDEFGTSKSRFRETWSEVNRPKLKLNKIIDAVHQRPDISPYRWVALFLAWLIYFSFGMIQVSISPLMTPIMRDLNLTYSQAGAILSAWQLTYIAAAFLVGLLIDRVGTYFSLALGVAIISISATLRGFAINFETMFMAVAIFGIGGPMISIGIPKLVASCFLGKERETATGIFVTGSTVGAAVSLATSNSILLPLVGTWQNALRLYALFGVLVIIVWLLAGRGLGGISKQQQGSMQSPSLPTFKVISILLKHRDMWLIVIIGLSDFFTSHGLKNWLPKILESRGMTPTNAGLITSIYTILSMTGSILMPRLSYHMGSRKHLIIPILLLGGVGVFLIGIDLGPLLWVGLIISGLTCGGLLPLMMVSLMELPEFGSKYMGIAAGMFFTIGEVGGFSAPLLMGYLRDLTGSFLAGVGMHVLMLEIMVPLAFLLKETPSLK